MAKEPLQEKELQIKKTARRRLVGAIAMVMILLVVLPFLLKDRATDSSQDPVKITIVSDAGTNEPIPELNDKEVGFESNVNPTEVTGYTQPTVLPSQQEANAPASESKTHIALPKVTPPPVAPSQTVDEHSKLSQVLDASNSSEPSQQVQESKTPPAEVKVNNDKLATNHAKPNVAEQNVQKAAEAKLAEEAKAKETKVKETAELAKKQADEASAKQRLEKEKAEKKKADVLKAEKLKAEKIKLEQEAKEKAQAEKAKQAKEMASKEAKSKEEKSSSASNATSGKFFVQYGVFSDPKNAEKLQSSLKQKGFEAETENIDANSKKVRLRSKVYSTKEEALKSLKSVQGAGFTAIVTGK